MAGKPCEFIPVSFLNARWTIKGKRVCTALAEEGSIYCPVHRGGIERKGPSQQRVKRDLDLDVLPMEWKSK